ncbi:MAG: glycosyltransferase [Flavobacteriales bacterium]
MKLSVVIVNYNVQHFLEQCLHSVEKAMKKTTGEVWVVDNNSVDGSVTMVKNKFPWVKLVESKINLGFSKGNNLAINQSQGDYILLLNPDTVVEEDTFEKIVRFMDEHPDAGGLGVNMVDGQGRFLPESKRGLPTPTVAFYKIFGLASLFPKSRIFGKYHLGFLDKNKNHEIEILSGACMLLRKTVIDKIGALDETFFMYGEDIDLSYRITQAGYKNYYFAGTRIIHYKGESTKKSSVNYVFVFYRAMIIFAKKHFSQKNASIFSFLINLAIYIRATFALIRRLVTQIWLPLLDATLIYSAMCGVTNYYESEIKHASDYFPQEFMIWEIPAFIAIWILATYLCKGYQQQPRLSNLTKGVIFGTLAIMIIYGLLPESLRFSRIMIFAGFAVTLLVMLLNRLIIHFIQYQNFDISFQRKKRIVIAGNKEEARRVSRILNLSYVKPIYTGIVSPNDEDVSADEDYIGNLPQLKEIIEVHKIDEIIFCAKDISAQKIIDYMTISSSDKIDFKIAPPESLFIIGSSSVNSPGELYVIDINSISKSINLKNKRIFDIITSSIVLLISPVLVFLVEKPFGLLKNALNVLKGRISWVGYCKINNTYQDLPTIKSGVLNPADILKIQPTNADTIKRLNMMYAKDYNIFNDLDIVIKGLKKLDRLPLH